MTPQQKAESLGIVFEKTAPGYLNLCIRSGAQLITSGHVSDLKGKLGQDVTTEQGYEAAKACGLQILATAQQALGSLDRISSTVKVLGMVNADSLFQNHPQVINGCSDLLVEVLGENGKHTRSAVGMGSLPGQISVEIEATFEFE